MGRPALLLGLAALVVYLWCAGPTFFWLDSPELVAAAWGLGIAHPPGHPLASLLGRLACLLPVGTIAFRVTLASALAAAASTSLLALICHQLLSRLGFLGRGSSAPVPEGAAPLPREGDDPPPAWIRPATCCIATACVALSYALAFQAVRAEVYALNLLLLLATVHLVLRWDVDGDRRWLFAAALALGLGLCNHHFLVLLAAPALLVFVVARRPRPGARRALVGVLLAGLLGLSTLAFLPLRARTAPEVNWGAPTTVQRFYWVVSAQTFHQALDKAASETVRHRALGAGFAVLGGLGPVAALGALGGLYLLLRRRASRRPALLLGGLVGLNLLSPMAVGFDPLNPDAHGYLVVAAAFLCPGLAVLLALLAELTMRVVGRSAPARGAPAALPGRSSAGPSAASPRWCPPLPSPTPPGALEAPVRPSGSPTSGANPSARWTRRLGPLLVCLGGAALPAYQAAVNLPQVDLRRHWAAEETGRQILEQPPGALLLTSYFETVFNVWALQVVGDLRPDLAIVHRNFLAQPGYVETLGLRQPELASIVARWRAAGRPLVDDLDRLAARRSVRLEWDLNVPADLAPRLSAAGLALAYATVSHASPGDLARHRERLERWAQAVGPIAEGETRRAVAWTHYLLLDFACRDRQDLPLARLHYARARALAPLDTRLQALSRRCGLRP